MGNPDPDSLCLCGGLCHGHIIVTVVLCLIPQRQFPIGSATMLTSAGRLLAQLLQHEGGSDLVTNTWAGGSRLEVSILDQC